MSAIRDWSSTRRERSWRSTCSSPRAARSLAPPRLDGLVRDLAAEWGLATGHVLSGGTEDLLLTVRTADGHAAVLKIAPPGLETLTGELRTLREAWAVPPPDERLMNGAEKAASLAAFIETAWRELGEPCSGRAGEVAPSFADTRRRAFDPVRAVLAVGLDRAGVERAPAPAARLPRSGPRAPRGRRGLGRRGWPVIVRREGRRGDRRPGHRSAGGVGGAVSSWSEKKLRPLRASNQRSNAASAWAGSQGTSGSGRAAR